MDARIHTPFMNHIYAQQKKERKKHFIELCKLEISNVYPGFCLHDSHSILTQFALLDEFITTRYKIQYKTNSIKDERRTSLKISHKSISNGYLIVDLSITVRLNCLSPVLLTHIYILL